MSGKERARSPLLEVECELSPRRLNVSSGPCPEALFEVECERIGILSSLSTCDTPGAMGQVSRSWEWSDLTTTAGISNHDVNKFYMLEEA